MKVLVSPVSPEEAWAAAEGGADIIDVKHVREGSLGASFPWIIREVVRSLRGRDVTFSATLVDLPFKPGPVPILSWSIRPSRTATPCSTPCPWTRSRNSLGKPTRRGGK